LGTSGFDAPSTIVTKQMHRHYGLLARSRTKANTLAQVRELIDLARPMHKPQPQTNQDHAPAGTEAIDQPVHPCPCCGSPDGHHRDVRGRLGATQQTDCVHDRGPHRYVMMVIATISRVIADRMCCWLMAGNDNVRPNHPPSLWHRPRNPLRNPELDAALGCKRVSRLIRRSAAGRMTPTMLRRRQPNLHSAR